MKRKYILTIALLSLLFLLNYNFAFALEVTYPSLPGIGGLTKDSGLPDYVRYFFGFGIYIAGVLAVISLSIGGIRLITSAGNPSVVGDARERIMGSVLGLVLTISAVIILKTINPTLITPILGELENLSGVYYTNGTDLKSVLPSESDTSAIVGEGFNDILYKCDAGPNLLVFKFPQKDFGGEENVKVDTIKCGGGTTVDSPSLKIAFETPGVYYCLGGCAGDVCQGLRSPATLANESQIPEPFKSKMKSVMVVQDAKNKIHYGAIFHSDINFRGTCKPILDIPADKGRFCRSFSQSPGSSITIFTLNDQQPKTSGNGVVFYSKPFGYKSGANAGYYHIKATDGGQGQGDEIGYYWNSAPSVINFTESYSNINVPEEEKELCRDFEKCPGSIKVQGNYLVNLYAYPVAGTPGQYCQIFNQDVPNIKATEVMNVEGRRLQNVEIIPVK